jgi:hypothetical protein
MTAVGQKQTLHWSRLPPASERWAAADDCEPSVQLVQAATRNEAERDSLVKDLAARIYWLERKVGLAK